MKIINFCCQKYINNKNEEKLAEIQAANVVTV